MVYFDAKRGSIKDKPPTCIYKTLSSSQELRTKL